MARESTTPPPSLSERHNSGPIRPPPAIKNLGGSLSMTGKSAFQVRCRRRGNVATILPLPLTHLQLYKFS
jgi:hypothetical protein